MIEYRTGRKAILSEPPLKGLPAGRLVSPDPGFSDHTEPVIWVSRDEVRDLADTAGDIRMSFQSHGLWPLVLDSERPWQDGELDPPSASPPEKLDAGVVLAQWWDEVYPERPTAPRPGLLDRLLGRTPAARSPVEPFERTFPGLAPTPDGDGDEGALGRTIARSRGRLGLVPCARPAYVLAALGWMGAVNHDGDPGKLSAVLRSWDDRFGAVPVSLGFDTLVLAVRRPPQTREEALALAAEHLAFCPDNVYQGSETITAYARGLVKASSWSFWWD